MGDGPSLFAPEFDSSLPDRARLYSVLEGRSPGRVLSETSRGRLEVAVRESWFGRVFFSKDSTVSFREEALTSLRTEGPVVLDEHDALSVQFDETSQVLARVEFSRRLSGVGEFEESLLKTPPFVEVRQLDYVSFEVALWRDALLRIFGTPERYLKESLGFGLFEEETLCSEAHAFFWGGDIVEIGAITKPLSQGRGYAHSVVAHLIQECEARGYVTYWGCDETNAASISLAERLGYGTPRPYTLVAYGLS